MSPAVLFLQIRVPGNEQTQGHVSQATSVCGRALVGALVVGVRVGVLVGTLVRVGVFVGMRVGVRVGVSVGVRVGSCTTRDSLLLRR